MRKNGWWTILLLICGLLLAAVPVLSQDGYDLSWWTVDGGGGTSSGGDFELSGTIGQPDAGTMAGGDFTLESGFWPGVACTAAAPDVTIAALASADVVLTWLHLGGNEAYTIYRDTTPTFTPSAGAEIGVVTAAPYSFTDPGRLGDPSTNHFYVVRASACGGAAVADAGRVGAFDYLIQPGTP